MPLSDQDAAALREFLADRDADCPACRYNLRALTTEVCPECNQALTLRVGLVEPIGSAYIATLVGLAVGASVATLEGTRVVVFWVARWKLPSGEWLYWSVGFMLLALVLNGALSMLVRRRGRLWFATRAMRERQAGVVLAWAVSMCGIAVWLYFMLP